MNLLEYFLLPDRNNRTPKQSRVSPTAQNVDYGDWEEVEEKPKETRPLYEVWLNYQAGFLIFPGTWTVRATEDGKEIEKTVYGESDDDEAEARAHYRRLYERFISI